MKKIAICCEEEVFQNGKILDLEYVRQFPGAGWLPLFANEMRERENIEVITGDIAINLLEQGKIKSSDIFVIKDRNAKHADALVELGARPFIIMNYESPLFAWSFYKNIDSVVNYYPYRILFKGAFELIKNDAIYVKNIPVYFHNFMYEDICPVVDWEIRKFMVLVAGNKYIINPSGIKNIMRNFLSNTKCYLRDTKEVTWASMLKKELHTKRYEAIKFFGKLGAIDLYGSNWLECEGIPREFMREIKPIAEKVWKGKCVNKRDVMKEYKFAICFENCAFNGYVTEKIIDCFVAGVIPIYLGAPDIYEYIPKETFIDMHDFKNMRELYVFLNNLKNEDALEYIKNGRKFIMSDEGKRYTFEGMADSVHRIYQDFCERSRGGMI